MLQTAESKFTPHSSAWLLEQGTDDVYALKTMQKAEALCC